MPDSCTDTAPIVSENLTDAMLDVYRVVGIFAHETRLRDRRADRTLEFDWIHAMHGSTLTREAVPHYTRVLRAHEFGWRGMLLGRELHAPA